MTLDTRELLVYIAGKPAGCLTITREGKTEFSYDAGYSGPQLSVAMPKTDTTYHGRILTCWLAGLLPDNRDIRESMAEGRGYSSESYFGLLADYGRDLPGAVLMVPAGSEEPLVDSYRELNEHEIGKRLREIESEEGKTSRKWLRGNERWSLGGTRGKIALALRDGRWYSCEGTAASNVIVKPGIAGFDHQALCECLTMRMARNMGISAAKTNMHSFDGVMALVVDRYDRISNNDGSIVRLHQEDMCQALGYMPGNKFQEDNGPSAADAIHLLNRIDETGDSTRRFVDALFFNNLIGGLDGHAKNYSVLILPDRNTLAPLYDIASTYPYMLAGETYATAMHFGHAKQLGTISKRDIKKLAKTSGMSEESITERCRFLLSKSIEAFEKATNSLSDVDGTDRLACSMAPRLSAAKNALSRNIENERVFHIPIANFVGTNPLSDDAYRKPTDNANMGEKIWVDSYERNGHIVHGHWRKAPKKRR